MRRFNPKILLLLSLGHLITDVYQGALPTILPFLKERLLLSYTTTGIILMVANFTSSLIQPVFGFVSDRKTKPILLPVGCLCAGIGFSLLSIPSSYVLILILVILSGLGIASYHPEGYKTAHFFTGEKKVTGMSIFSVGGNLGFAFGPMLSIYIIKYLGFSFLPTMGILALFFTIFIVLFWRNITIPINNTGVTTAQQSSYEVPKGTYLALLIIITIVIMRSCIQMGLMSYIPFYYISYLQGDALYAGKLVSAFLFGGVLGTLGGAPLADRWGHKRYVTLSMLFATLVLPLIFMTESYALFVVLALLGTILISTFTVTIVMAQTLLPRNLGIASGLMVGFAIGAGGLFVTLLGVVADHFGVPVALKSIMILPLIGFTLCLVLRYPEQKNPEF